MNTVPHRVSSLCEDCNATQRLIEVSAGITILQILHDDTCPWLSERTFNGHRRT